MQRLDERSRHRRKRASQVMSGCDARAGGSCGRTMGDDGAVGGGALVSEWCGGVVSPRGREKVWGRRRARSASLWSGSQRRKVDWQALVGEPGNGEVRTGRCETGHVRHQTRDHSYIVQVAWQSRCWGPGAKSERV